jgi:hypothetical protein
MKISRPRVANNKNFSVPLQPASTGGGQTEKRERKKIKTFSLQIWKVRKVAYLCTPNHKQGWQTVKKGAACQLTRLR